MNKARDCWQAVLRQAAALLLGICAMSGCVRTGTADAPRATDVPPEQAQPVYWLDQPGVTSVEHHRFEPLWQACEEVLRRHHFRIDRRDWRLGLITTHPMVSRQFFEVWRYDTATVADAAQSSLGTVRRTVRIEVTRLPDQTYVAVPKVVVERLSAAERRYTHVLQYAGAVPQAQPQGSPEADRGVQLPEQYWYALGRDHALERRLADSAQRQLDRRSGR